MHNEAGILFFCYRIICGLQKKEKMCPHTLFYLLHLHFIFDKYKRQKTIAMHTSSARWRWPWPKDRMKYFIYNNKKSNKFLNASGELI